MELFQSKGNFFSEKSNLKKEKIPADQHPFDSNKEESA